MLRMDRAYLLITQIKKTFDVVVTLMKAIQIHEKIKETYGQIHIWVSMRPTTLFHFVNDTREHTKEVKFAASDAWATQWKYNRVAPKWKKHTTAQQMATMAIKLY